MSALTVKHFSAVDYMQRLKKAKFTEEQAEIVAKETEELITNILEQTQLNLEKKELATKQDLMNTKLELQKEIEILRKEIAQSSNKVIIWIVGFVIASGLLQHFFK
jgi:hypothetical protein